MKNQQADPENLLGCDIANERKVGIGKSIWDFVRIIGLVTVLAYMMIILAVWIWNGDYFTAGESNPVIKYTEWFLGLVGIVSLFEIIFKQFATIPKRYFKHFGTLIGVLIIILVGNSINAEALGTKWYNISSPSQHNGIRNQLPNDIQTAYAYVGYYVDEEFRTLFLFNIGLPSYTTIVKAELHTWYLVDTDYYQPPGVVNIYKITSPWTSSVSWNTQPTISSIVGTADYSSATINYNPLEIVSDVTTDTQNIITSGTNYGWMFIDPSLTTPKIAEIYSWGGPALDIQYYNTPPTIPSITNPTNNSIGYNVTIVNMTWNPSTDADGDSITYSYQIANDSAFTDVMHSGTTANTFTGDKTIPANSQMFFRVRAYDTYDYSAYSSTISIRSIVLSSPTNVSTISFSYPPSTTDVNFSWTATYSATTNYNLIVARDINFNLVVSDTTFSGTYKILSLDNDTYYWKVRPYYTDTATYGAYTLPWEFTTAISGSTEFGTAIRGTVFEALNGIITPISGATVTLYNNSLSSTQTQITGSNGYYLFTGLSNSTTYNIKASRQDIYTDSQTYYLTTGLGTTLTQDIQLQRCVSGFNCFYNQHYVKFVVQNWYGATKYSGVATTVYKGADVAPMTVQCTQLNCVTGTDGAVDILLVKDQQYRITFVDASQGISQTFTVTPFEERYYIIVSTSTGNNWWGTNNTYSEVGSIIVSVSTSSTASTGWVNVTYQDNLAQTTGLIFYLNQTNKTLATSPQIVIQSYNAGAVSNYTQNFSISSYAGNSYIVNVEAKHTTFGNVVRSFGVHFEGLKSTAVSDVIPPMLQSILAMGFMIFIGAIFGESRRAIGAAVMVILGWIFLGAGFFAYFGSARIGAGLVMATIVVVMWNFNERRSSEGMQ